MKRLVAGGLVGVALLGMLSGCSTENSRGSVDDSLDVYGAKEVAQSMEVELAGFVPAENVSSSDQLDEGILLSCGIDDVFQWTGHNYLTLVGSVDSDQVVDAIARAFENRAPFAARIETTQDGAPRVRVVGPAGASYSLAPSVDGSRIEIFSFSPCFRLSQDLSPHDRY